MRRPPDPRRPGPNRRWAWSSLALGVALMTGVQLAEARTVAGGGDFAVAAAGSDEPSTGAVVARSTPPDPAPPSSTAAAPAGTASSPGSPPPPAPAAAVATPADVPVAPRPPTASTPEAPDSAVSGSDAPHTDAPSSDAPSTKAPDTAPPAVPVAAGTPLELRLPRLDVQAPIDPVGLTDGELEVPEDIERLGWWTGSTAAGGASGTTVIDGHIDSPQGRGVFFHLQEVEPDDEVVLTVAGGATVAYRVTERRSYGKADGLPAEVFASTAAPRLVLITCGGRYDHSRASYDDNIVVIAVPA